MNRPRKTKGPYPPCFYPKHGSFYLVKANKWTRLGTDLGVALAEYARLMGAAESGGMRKLIDDAMPGILKDKAASTKEQYELAAKTLKRKLRLFEPQQVTLSTIYAIQESMASTPNMANRTISVLNQVFTYAARKRIVQTNPCIGAKRLPESKRKRLLTDDEWAAIHAAAGQRLKVIMELQMLTGQRINDVLKIRRSQLTDEGVMFEQQKTGAKLLIRWTPELRKTVKAAEALSKGLPPTLTLLRGKYGNAPDYRSVLLQWHEARKAAGVEDAKPNDGRARSATAAKLQGKNPQALLGHTSPTHTARYLRDRETPAVDGPSIRQALSIGQKRKS